MDDLQYVDEYERSGRFPAAFAGMSELVSAGLITATSQGWGHYRVALTAEGRKKLEGGTSTPDRAAPSAPPP